MQGSCSTTCGNGTVTRIRECIRPFGGVCQGPDRDIIPCNYGNCPSKLVGVFFVDKANRLYYAKKSSKQIYHYLPKTYISFLII